MGEQRWALSGGLASGKSRVREFLASVGMKTIDADRVGHQVLESEGPVFAQVATRWPHVVRSGEIERSALARTVFDDPRELEALEAITHPHIFDMIRAQVEEVDGPVIVEVPILQHGLGSEWCRMVVDCRDEVRVERAVERGMTRDDAMARMAQQPSRARWLSAADLVVPNHSSVEALNKTVSALIGHI